MRIVLKYLKPFSAQMACGFIIKVTGTLSELMIPYILTHILKNVIGKSVRDILLWGGLMVICSVIACICNIIANRMAARVSRNFAEALRKDLL